MSESRIGKLCIELNQWYGELEEEEQQLVNDLIKEGYPDILQWLEEYYPNVRYAYAVLQAKIHLRMKEDTLKKVRANLKRNHLIHPLLDSMTEIANDALEHYRASTALRSMDHEEFERITTLIVLDNYVERRFNSWQYCNEYLGLGDKEKTKQCYHAINNLIHQHYEQLDTLEELGEFMDMELSFDTKKIEIFLQILLKHREALDRFMLFKKLIRIERMIGKEEED